MDLFRFFDQSEKLGPNTYFRYLNIRQFKKRN